MEDDKDDNDFLEIKLGKFINEEGAKKLKIEINIDAN
jgi:hypothetical protein